MLTDNQKAQVRLLIQSNPSPTYMAQLAASDDFALSELAKFLPTAIVVTQKAVTLAQNQINSLNAKLAILQAQ